MAYGKKYYMSFERTFTNPKGVDMVKNYQFNIYFQGYTGVPIELPCMGDSPVVLRYDGDKDNIFEPIVKGSMEFELVNVTGFVFDDMIEAGDADCWCELVEQGDKTTPIQPTVFKYRYSSGYYVRFFQNPLAPTNYQVMILNEVYNVNGAPVPLVDGVSNILNIPYSPTASYPLQQQQVFTGLLTSLNARYNPYGIYFIDNGNLDMDVVSYENIEFTHPKGGFEWYPSTVYVNLYGHNFHNPPIEISPSIPASTDKLIFSGFLSPAGIVRPYTNSPSTMKFVASDGLNLLNNTAYGSIPSDLSDVNMLTMLTSIFGFRNKLINTAIKDDLYVEWDFAGSEGGGGAGGSSCKWTMVAPHSDEHIVLYNYDVTIRIYRPDGITYDTRVFKNKGDFDAIAQETGTIQYDANGVGVWVPYTDELTLKGCSLKLSRMINNKLKALNVYSDTLLLNSAAIGIISNAHLFIERLIFGTNTLAVTNEYRKPSDTILDLSKLTVDGELFAGKSMYSALEYILKSFGWRMYYHNGWRVERVINIGKAQRSFYKYKDVTGARTTVDLARIKDEGSDYYIESASETRINSWRDVTFKQPYGRKDSLVYNGKEKFDFAYAPEFNGYRYKWAYGNAYCMKDKSGKNLLIGTDSNTVDYAVFKGFGIPKNISIKFIGIKASNSVSVKIKIWVDAANQYMWVGEDSKMHVAMQTITKVEESGNATFDINLIGFFLPGQIELFLSNQSDGSEVLVSAYSVNETDLKHEQIGYELMLNINQLNRNKTKEIEFPIGNYLQTTGSLDNYNGLLKISGNYLQAVSVGNSAGRLADIIGNEYAYVYANNRMCINGTITRNVEPTDALKFANGKILTFASIGSFDIKRNRLEGEFVEVVSQSYILRIEPLLPINIAPLDTPTLPATVVATFSDGTAQTIPVTWEKFTQTSPGTYIAKGYVGVNMANVEQTVIIEHIASYTPLASVTVEQNQPATLPATAHCTTTGGLVRDYAITWTDKDTSVIGTRIIKGIVAYGFEVALTMIVTPMLTDLDILHQIRDANPTSQLPTLWRDDEDPYTQWEGVVWYDSRVTELGMRFLDNKGITSMPSVNKLAKLQILRAPGNSISSIDLSGMVLLRFVSMEGNKLVNLDLTGTINIVELYVNLNRLTSIPSLTSKGAIISANFTRNLMPPTETDRLINVVGFTPAQVLPQDLP